MKETIRPLTEAEQNRMIEIHYYMFISNLLEAYNRSALITDVLEALATLYACDLTTLKTLASAVYQGYSSFVPSKAELSVMLYRSGMPIRDIRRTLKIHPQTVYRQLKEYIEQGQFEYAPKLDEESRTTLVKFMENVERLSNWR